MNWDRAVSITNLVAVLVGGLAATYEWVTFKHTYEEQTLKQLTYANEQLKIALGTDEQKPLDYDGDLTATEVKKFADGTSLYNVRFDVKSKNTSKSLVHISYSVAELYLGDPSNKELAPSSAIDINDAPDPWHSQKIGLISWRRIAYEADVDDGATNPAVSKWMKDHHYTVISHWGMTGIFLSGTSHEYVPHFLIRAKPSQYVSIVIGFGIDDSLDVASPNVGLASDSQILGGASNRKNSDVSAKNASRLRGDK